MMRSLCVLLPAAQVLCAQSAPGGQVLREPLKQAIESHLGRPYVWGACGLKSFDCSGFVWRVMLKSGLFIKRTTARKLYMSLPAVPASNRFQPGNIVFFDNLTHCGIVNSRADFYHAQIHKGTNRSEFEPFWRPKICGFRKMPQ